MTYLNKKLKYSGTLKVLTGLHIGDSSENVQIGAVDAPVVRRRDNNQPYIPGSSLKGKIRCLLEQANGNAKLGGSAEINKLFGINAHMSHDKEDHPARVVFRDSYLTKDSENALANSEFTDYPYTEVKFENTIDRVTGTAGNPRKFERVPVGAEFSLSIILNVWDDDDEKGNMDLLKEGIHLLMNDYLGGSGSRGYGQVEINVDLEKPEIVYSKG